MLGLSFSEILLIAIPLVFLWVNMKRGRDKDERQAGPASVQARGRGHDSLCGVRGLPSGGITRALRARGLSFS